MKEKYWQKNKNIWISILLTICFIIIIVFGSLNIMIFNKDFYKSEYSKNNVYDKIPQNKTLEMTDNIISFFRGSSELKYFSESEKSHMQDVRGLIRTMQYIYYASSLLAIAIFFYLFYSLKHDRIAFITVLKNSLLYSGIVSVAGLLLVFLMCVFYFNFTFTLFHLVFFPQGNWMFDGASSQLLMLFPEQFFFDISLRIFIYAMFQALVFLGIGLWIRKQLKIHEKHHV